MDMWHLSNMKVILTIWTLNFAEPCVTFSCIDSFAFDQIKWRCAMTKHTVLRKKLKSKNVIYCENLWKCNFMASRRVSFSCFYKVALDHAVGGGPDTF